MLKMPAHAKASSSEDGLSCLLEFCVSCLYWHYPVEGGPKIPLWDILPSVAHSFNWFLSEGNAHLRLKQARPRETSISPGSGRPANPDLPRPDLLSAFCFPGLPLLPRHLLVATFSIPCKALRPATRDLKVRHQCPIPMNRSSSTPTTTRPPIATSAAMASAL